MHKQYYYQIKDLEDLSGEEWKTIDVAPLYSVSNLGRVKAETCEKWHSKRKRLMFYPAKIISQGNNNGYLVVSLVNNTGKRKTYRVNRLVANAFLPNPLNLPDVCHRNEDKLDNRLVNLKWGSHKENVNNYLHKIKISKAKGTHVKCDGHEFTSINKAAKFYGNNLTEMWLWLTGKKPMPKEWQDRGLQIIKEVRKCPTEKKV